MLGYMNICAYKCSNEKQEHANLADKQNKHEKMNEAENIQIKYVS